MFPGRNADTLLDGLLSVCNLGSLMNTCRYMTCHNDKSFTESKSYGFCLRRQRTSNAFLLLGKEKSVVKMQGFYAGYKSRNSTTLVHILKIRNHCNRNVEGTQDETSR